MKSGLPQFSKIKLTHFKIYVFASLTVFASIFYILNFTSHANEIITNETILASLRKPHSIMLQQRERIHAIMDGFLTGDLESVQTYVNDLARDIKTIALEEVKPSADGGMNQWQSVATIVQEAEELKKQINEKNYQKAYQHFSALTFQCIRCHQAQRSWGVFEEPKEKTEKEPADSENQKPTVNVSFYENDV